MVLRPFVETKLPFLVYKCYGILIEINQNLGKTPILNEEKSPDFQLLLLDRRFRFGVVFIKHW
jgi:hypothetical protein